MQAATHTARPSNVISSKVVYIASVGHSGSSLLDALLGKHPQIAGTGEIHRLTITPDTRSYAQNYWQFQSTKRHLAKYKYLS